MILDKSSTLVTSATNRARCFSGSQSCREGGSRKTWSRSQVRNRLLTKPAYPISKHIEMKMFWVSIRTLTPAESIPDRLLDHRRCVPIHWAADTHGDKSESPAA